MSDYQDKIKAQKLAKINASVATRVVTAVTKIVQPDVLLSPSVTHMAGGIDPDFYAGSWSPQTAKQNGVFFALIRAGEYFEDVQFASSWALSRGVMPRGAYWFLTKNPITSISRQARIFASLFPNGYDGEIPIILDMEEDINYKVRGSNKPVHLDISDAWSFMQVFGSLVPNWDKKWVYYSNWNWQMHFGTQDTKILDVPFWYSNPPPYASPDRMFNPIMPDPWKRYGKTYKFIQTSFAGDGHLYGVQEKGIDLDYYNGTPDQLAAEFPLR